MKVDEDAIREQIPAKAWDDMSLWEKSWVVICALDSSADLRLERRVQKLEHQLAALQRQAARRGEAP